MSKISALSGLGRIYSRKRRPVPFEDCGTLAWDDPEIAQRLLEVHLSQETDQASRTLDRIALECEFLDDTITRYVGAGTRVLDLTCGPGFYAAELSRRGFNVVGVDFSPASISYAKKQNKHAKPPIEFIQGDVRTVDFPDDSFDAAFYIYGMPNALTRQELESVSAKIARWVRPGGLYISELLSLEGLRDDETCTWDTMDRSPFLDGPQMWLDEKIWNEKHQSQVYRIYILDLKTGKVQEHCESHQAYTVSEYADLLEAAGFETDSIFNGLELESPEEDTDWLSFVSRRI